MQVSKLQIYSPSMQAGLYFTKKSNVLYNQDRNISFVTKEAVKVSKNGCRYIEDNLIPKDIKERFANIPFIQKLSEQFDTFVFYREMPEDPRNNAGWGHRSFAEIGWADFSKKMAEKRRVHGVSPVSQKSATDNMFENLRSCKFD